MRWGTQGGNVGDRDRDVGWGMWGWGQDRNHRREKKTRGDRDTQGRQKGMGHGNRNGESGWDGDSRGPQRQEMGTEEGTREMEGANQTGDGTG